MPLWEPEVIESSQATRPVETSPLSVCRSVALPLPIEPAVHVREPEVTSFTKHAIISPFAVVVKAGVDTELPALDPDMEVCVSIAVRNPGWYSSTMIEAKFPELPEQVKTVEPPAAVNATYPLIFDNVAEPVPNRPCALNELAGELVGVHTVGDPPCDALQTTYNKSPAVTVIGCPLVSREVIDPAPVRGVNELCTKASALPRCLTTVFC